MAADHGTGHIIQALFVNLVIAVAKGVAAVFTGSGAMLAETLHSFADCGNQLLLLFGVKRSRKPPTPQHPFGHGPVLYFWSFMVALMLFAGGGVFSIYEGIHKLGTPESPHHVALGLGILAFSLGLESWTTLGNIRELNRRRGAKGFVRYLKDTKDSDLVVIFGENSAAVIGLVFAMAALGLAAATGDGRWDAAGSLAIGVVLVLIALFLAVEVKSLLVGERADPEVEAAARTLVAEDPRILEVLALVTIQRGPGEVMAVMKLSFEPALAVPAVCEAINDFEARLRVRCPEVKWCFVEPDMPKLVVQT